MRYHVFLSFRGPDSRKTFTDHLYAALVRKGIVTFRDDEEIKKGEAVSEKLREAIQQSLYFIIVLSQEFASSEWCLDELVEIVETKPKQTVFPVFYDVKPGDIRQALAELQGGYSRAEMKRWRKALSQVAKVSGWPTIDRHEAKLVEEIATHIWNRLCDQVPSNFEYLVGDIKSKAETIISLLRIGLDDKFFIGIWGMGGAGKTTLGRVVYDAVKKENFDASCFLANIRDDTTKFGIVHLQKKLLSNLKLGEPNINDFFHGAEIIRSFLCDKKVLIVLDDVSHRSQLDYLARNKEWFGAGSRIIITTRDKHLLTQYERFDEHKVDMLCYDESLKLLCQKAFKKDQPEEGFSNLSDEVVGYAGGHPMALEVLGSFLCRRDENEWRCTIDRFRQNLNKEILSQLRISYDELEEKYKAIFLDIACFFNKQARSKVANMLKICGLDEMVGMKVLTEKSLLSSSQWQTARERQNMYDSPQRMRACTEIEAGLYKKFQEEASEEYLYMHDLLQEMGRNIVFQESPIHAGRRSRLWSLEDIDLVLKENKGTKHVQSIVLEAREVYKADWDANCFSKMINLRLLDLSKVHLSTELGSLPTALKFLRWDDYNKNCLPSIDKLSNLESLQLCNSSIEKLWEGKPVLNKLRSIDMSDSESLSETPDFSGTPSLEELLLDRCRKLTQVHDSVGQLKKLVKLSLRQCKRLEFLPTKFETDNLQEFILMGCMGLEKLPDFGQNMTNLYFFAVSDTNITQIPSTIKYLTKLKILDMQNCYGLKSLPADLPPHLIVCASNSPELRHTIAQLNLTASRVPKRPRDLQGPIHIFGEFKAEATILQGFQCSEYCWGEDPSGEFVTITADIPSNVVADSNEECWGIAICLFFKSIPQASLSSYIVWTFQDHQDQCQTNKTKMDDQRHTIKTKMDGNLTPDDDWKVYVGFYPFDKEQCRSHPSDDGEATQLDLSLYILTTSTARELGDLAIMGCRWRLASKLDFDKWRRGESSSHGITEREGNEEQSRNSVRNTEEDSRGRLQRSILSFIIVLAPFLLLLYIASSRAHHKI